MGTQLDPDKDIITFTEDANKHKTTFITLLFHKPIGIVSNCPEPGQKQITDLLPKEYATLNTIGRLDKDSEGLILLTNDGVLAKKLLNHEHPREYSVRVNNPVTDEMIHRLETGVMILGRTTNPASITMLTDYTFTMRVNEGRNRQIRRMAEEVGLKVIRLKRFRYGPITLGDLKKGEYRLLTDEEKRQL